MNIFITGGTGFIGSYIVTELIRNEHFVTILARDPDKIQGFINHDRITFIKGTLSDHEIIEAALVNQDVCIHNALGWGTTASLMLEADTRHSVFIFEAAARQHVRQIIYTSSTAAMGDYRAVMDKNTPNRPLDFYGATKAATEAYLLAIAQACQVRSNIIRPGYTFGNPVVDGAPMQPDARFKEIVQSARQNKDINLIQNDGTQFIWAGYLAEIYHAVLSSDTDRHIYFGLGSDYITWEYIAGAAIQYLDSKSRIVLEDKGWKSGGCVYDSQDIDHILGTKADIKTKIIEHIKYIAGNELK